VAKLAQVSAMTVSRALNTPELVSEDVRRRVADAISRTGYVPNLLAGGLASSRSRLVAAIVPTLTGPVFLPTVAVLTEALAERGYQLMLGQSGYEGHREDELLEAVIGRRPDGIVLTGVMHSPEGRRRLQAAGVPVVETWDLSLAPIDMLVGFSHSAVGTAVADYLRARGRRRLAVVTGSDRRAGLRAQGFVSAALGAGLAEPEVVTVPAPTTMRSGRAAMQQLASLGLDGIFCSSDLLAMGVAAQAQVDGRVVGQDLAVVGFGDLEFAADTVPALTTVHIDAQDIGRQAARFIVERAEGREVGERVVDVGFRIVERASG
jgi:LacI family gluconate utilization system Gnt-I transcriptional repressor